MARDFSREQLPPPYVWNMVDFIPNVLGAPLRKRGGWIYASSAVTAASYLQRVGYGNFGGTAGSQLIAIDSTTSTSAGPGVWKVNETSGAVTFIGSVTSASAGGSTGVCKVGDPVFYGTNIFIPIGFVDGVTDVFAGNATYARCTKYNGTTLSKITY